MTSNNNITTHDLKWFTWQWKNIYPMSSQQSPRESPQGGMWSSVMTRHTAMLGYRYICSWSFLMLLIPIMVISACLWWVSLSSNNPSWIIMIIQVISYVLKSALHTTWPSVVPIRRSFTKLASSRDRLAEVHNIISNGQTERIKNESCRKLDHWVNTKRARNLIFFLFLTCETCMILWNSIAYIAYGNSIVIA